MNAELRSANLRLVSRFLDALNAWDLETLAAITSADVVMEVPFRPAGFERITAGRENYLELLRQASTVMIDGSENLHDIQLDTLHSDPNEVLAFYKSAMTLRSGVPYSNEYVSRFSIREGRIARFVEHLDSIRLFTALGGRIGGMDSVDDPSLLPPLLQG